MTTTTKVTTVLTGTADWDTWYTVIKMVAKGKLIWDYINPETPEDSCPKLIKPAEPAFSAINTDAEMYIDLDATEREAYKFMYQKYKVEYDKYKVLHTAISTHSAEIIRSLSPAIVLYIWNCEGTHNVLVELQTQFAPTDKTGVDDHRKVPEAEECAKE